MNVLKQEFWRKVAHAIEPHCANAAGYILERLEEKDLENFCLLTHKNKCTIASYWSGKIPRDILHEIVEEDLGDHLQWKDPKGTFEGLPIEMDK
jgi:hypothetical protein